MIFVKASCELGTKLLKPGIPIKGLLSSGWPKGMYLRHFLYHGEMLEGPAHHGWCYLWQVGLGWIKKIAEPEPGSTLIRNIFLWFCLQAPVLSSCFGFP